MRVRFTWNNPYSSVYDGSRFDSITSQNAAGDEDLAQRAKFSPGGLHRKFQVERKKKEHTWMQICQKTQAKSAHEEIYVHDFQNLLDFRSCKKTQR